MKKNVYIIFLLLNTVLIGQNFISKIHCLKNKNFTVFSSIRLQNNQIMLSGNINPKNGNINDDEYFISKLDDNGNIIWFKIFEKEQRWSFISLTLLSNQNVLLHFNPYSTLETPRLATIDVSGNFIWSKEVDYRNNIQIVDIPNEKAVIFKIGFSDIFLDKLDYSGNILWSKNYIKSSLNSLYFPRISLFDDDKLILSTSIGQIANNFTQLDSLGIYIIDAKTGKPKMSKKIYTPEKDTLTIEKITQINNDILIIGHTGETTLSNKNGRFNNAFIFAFDKSLNSKWARKIAPNTKRAFSFIDAFEYNANNLLLIGNNNAQKSLDSIFTISKFNLQSLSIDSTVFLKQGNVKLTAFPYNFSNGKGFFYAHDVRNGFSVVNTNNFFLDANCKLKKANLLSKKIDIIVENDNIFPVDLPIVILVAGKNTKMSNTAFKTFDLCPECNCPDTSKINAITCEGQPFKITINNKEKQFWTAGIYTDTIKFSNGCINFQELTINTTPKLENKIEKFICTTQPSIKIAQKTYTKEGIFTDTLKTQTGCDSILNITIKSLTDFKVSLGEDQEIIEGDKITLNAQSGYDNIIKKYTWLPVGTSSCDTCKSISIAPNKNQSFVVQASVEGCTATDSINIKVLNENLVFIPNAFSPNNDQINDFFSPFAAASVAEIENFSVYDRWGNQLYEANNYTPNDPKIGWDGTFRGSNVSEDIYIYTAQIRLKNGKIKKFAGDVKLFR